MKENGTVTSPAHLCHVFPKKTAPVIATDAA
jgi:hypothetical protein